MPAWQFWGSLRTAQFHACVQLCTAELSLLPTYSDVYLGRENGVGKCMTWDKNGWHLKGNGQHQKPVYGCIRPQWRGYGPCFCMAVTRGLLRQRVGGGRNNETAMHWRETNAPRAPRIASRAHCGLVLRCCFTHLGGVVECVVCVWARVGTETGNQMPNEVKWAQPWVSSIAMWEALCLQSCITVGEKNKLFER